MCIFTHISNSFGTIISFSNYALKLASIISLLIVSPVPSYTIETWKVMHYLKIIILFMVAKINEGLEIIIWNWFIIETCFMQLICWGWMRIVVSNKVTKQWTASWSSFISYYTITVMLQPIIEVLMI